MSGRDRAIVVFADDFGMAQVREALSADQKCLRVIDPQRIGGVEPGEATVAFPGKDERTRFLNEIGRHAPVFGIVCSFSRVLWPDLIGIFSHGLVNLHAGPLPAYRGANPLQWVLINGEARTAVTLHYIDEGVDTGPIIARETVEIESGDDALSLREKLRLAGSVLLQRYLPQLLAGRVPATPQDECEARHWPRRKPEDGLIDWSQSDRQISNLTRALVAPWPGVHTTDENGDALIIDRALSPVEVAELRRRLNR